jgi:putative transposase
VVERSFAWFGRNRRLAKDYETLTPTSEAFLYAASVIILLRRIARC